MSSMRDWTANIPHEIVAKPLTIGVWCSTIPNELGPNGRPIGAIRIGITLGEDQRSSRNLSPDEARYVLAALRCMAEEIAQRDRRTTRTDGAKWADHPDIQADWPTDWEVIE